MPTYSEELHKYIRGELSLLEEELEEQRLDYGKEKARRFRDFMYDLDGESIFAGETNVNDISESSYHTGYNDGKLETLRDLSKLLPKD
jgi:hypothetical protein